MQVTQPSSTFGFILCFYALFCLLAHPTLSPFNGWLEDNDDEEDDAKHATSIVRSLTHSLGYAPSPVRGGKIECSPGECSSNAMQSFSGGFAFVYGYVSTGFVFHLRVPRLRRTRESIRPTIIMTMMVCPSESRKIKAKFVV